ncbi:MAG: HD domain-containing protein [Sedimentisphaerales bacterium]|nr:HD domain-containing protein [Sedimentisphaerales bacterium]
MPILTSVKKLKPGMVLDQNVVNGVTVLLKYGITLTPEHIDSLLGKIPNKKVRIVDSALDEIVTFQDDSRDQDISQIIRSEAAKLFTRTSRMVRPGMPLYSKDCAPVLKGVYQLIDTMGSCPVKAALIDEGADLAEHTANVFYLCVAIGYSLRNYMRNERHRLSYANYIKNAMDLKPLATAAMFHDIGLVPIWPQINKPEKLTREEIRLIRQHPKTSADMLPDTIHPLTRQAVLMHHENHDSSGYPQRMEKNKINVLAKVIRVADAFSAAITSRSYRPAKTPIEALYEMAYGKCRQYYDTKILRILSTIIQPIPIGAKLKLKSGLYAVVTKHTYKEPFNPEIVIAFDKEGNPLPTARITGPFPLQTLKRTGVESFDGKDISYINGISKFMIPKTSDIEINHKYREILDLVYP